ncbi:MAG: hypothetical protein QNJ22_19580 [Desulfosarcinaceae bacterium]|nr:hypothetical protein [Desulfosarcinaceae bacterium]
MHPDQIRRPLATLMGLMVMPAILLTAASAWSHGLSVFAWVEGTQVQVESKFSGGKRPVNAVVRVLDLAGNQLLEGRTDSQGRWVFDLPQRTPLRIVMEAGLGHRGEWLLQAAETKAAGEESGVTETPSPPPATLPAAEITTDHLEAHLRQVVEEALQPLQARLARLEERRRNPGLQEILGGLGYILGLVGVGAYVQARRIRARRTAGRGQAP